MAKTSETIRKITRFLLAAFLWSHALFLLNGQSSVIDSLTRFVHFTTAEVILCILLVVFSFVAGSGFWKTVVNLAYIYCFPFVLIWYFLYCCFHLAKFAARLLISKSQQGIPKKALDVSPAPPALILSDPMVDSTAHGIGMEFYAVIRTLARPFQKFTLLWFLLLVLATHTPVVWVALAVLLLHLARTVYRVVKFSVFSRSWLVKIEDWIRNTINTTLDKLSVLNFETVPITELKNLFTQIKALEIAVRFIESSPAVSRWTWVVCGTVLISIYGYLAIFFSFAYLGISRVAGIPFSWLDSLVTSLFIPFYVGDLPKQYGLRIVGGIQCTLVLTVGVGTIFNYFRQRLESLRSVATLVSVRLSADQTRERYLILQQKVEAIPQAEPSNPK